MPLADDVADELTATFREQRGRCLATLIRVLGDIDLAEDALADAFAVATQRWPVDGVPSNPGAWITVTARNRAIDRLRRESTRDARQRSAQLLAPSGDADHLGRALDLDGAATVGDADLDDLALTVPDDRLRLVFLCCHPALSPDARVALSLRLVAGLEVADIAAGFVVPEATMAKRLVRAKAKLRQNRAPYRIPSADDLPHRLATVLAVLNAVFTQGHRPTSGDAPLRVDLTAEAIRLARFLVALMPDEPEAVGLLALMLLTDARRPARFAASGEFVALADQDRSLWDRASIEEGHALVRECLRRNAPGPFQIQAAIAAVHADAPHHDRTDWAQVVALYDRLVALRPDPIVAINRAVAVGELHGAAAGVAALDALDPADRSTLDRYQPFHAVRAGLLQRAGRHTEAVPSFDEAIALAASPAEAAFLAHRRAASVGMLSG